MATGQFWDRPPITFEADGEAFLTIPRDVLATLNQSDVDSLIADYLKTFTGPPANVSDTVVLSVREGD